MPVIKSTVLLNFCLFCRACIIIGGCFVLSGSAIVSKAVYMLVIDNEPKRVSNGSLFLRACSARIKLIRLISLTHQLN